MASSSSSSSLIPNPADPSTPYTLIQIPHAIKLTSTNYVAWKTQIQATLLGYDLWKFVDGTNPSPPASITHADGTTITNPALLPWFRQDRLVFGAIVGTLSQDIVPLVSHTVSSEDAWNVLAKTYANPSRGHLKQIKNTLTHITHTNQSISAYMNSIKVCTDRLSAMGKPMDHEDITEKVLSGLDYEQFKSVIDAVNARDTPISFDELHEKLINKEATATLRAAVSLPATVNIAQHRPYTPTPGLLGSAPSAAAAPNRPARPYLGKCQWCRVQGHSLGGCSVFKQQFPTIVVPSPSFNRAPKKPYHAPQAHVATVSNPTAESWLLDSGASHHVTNDLNNLSLHCPYDNTEELTIGDGSSLPIHNTGSFTLHTSSHKFHFNNVLHVPNISRNILSISQFCKDNHMSIEFLPSSFCVKDLSTSQVLLQGQIRNGVYEWHPSISPHVFHSSKLPSSEWHHK